MPHIHYLSSITHPSKQFNEMLQNLEDGKHIRFKHPDFNNVLLEDVLFLGDPYIDYSEVFETGMVKLTPKDNIIAW